MKEFFIAAPAAGEFYFLHAAVHGAPLLGMNDYTPGRGANNAVLFTEVAANAIIAIAKGFKIKGAETWHLVHVDEIFGFIPKEQKQTETKYKKVAGKKSNKVNPKQAKYVERTGSQRPL